MKLGTFRWAVRCKRKLIFFVLFLSAKFLDRRTLVLGCAFKLLGHFNFLIFYIAHSFKIVHLNLNLTLDFGEELTIESAQLELFSESI